MENEFEKYKTMLTKNWEVTIFKVIDLLRTLELEFNKNFQNEKKILSSLIINKKLDINSINECINAFYKKLELEDDKDIADNFKEILKNLFIIKKNFFGKED